MTQKNADITLSPAKITLIYLFVAALWIIFSDRALESVLPNLENLSSFQTYKGLFYVAITGIGLYYLIEKFSRQVQTKDEKLKTEQELTAKLFRRIPVMITIYDPDLNEFQVNKEFEKVIGWTNKEIEEGAVNLLEACYPDHNRREEMVEFMNNPGIGWKEFEMTTKSGETIPASWTNIRLTDDTSVGIGIDMSDIKASQAEVRESRELLKKTFESLQESIIILDPATRTIIDCNEYTEKLFGYSYSELTGSTTQKLHVDESHFERFDEMNRKRLENNSSFETEYRMKHKNGTVFDTAHSVSFVFDEEGNPDKVISTIRDITARKKYEQKLKTQARKLRRSQEIAKTGYWEYELDPDTEPRWSESLYKIYGLDPQTYTPTIASFLEMIVPEDRPSFETFKDQVVEEGIVEHTFRLEKPDGSIAHFRSKNELLTDEQGQPELILGIVQEITDLKKAEQKILREKQRFQLVAQTTSDVIWDLDLHDNTVWWSEGFKEVFGYDLTDSTTSLEVWENNVHPDDKEQATQSLQQAIESNKTHWKEKYRFLRADGSIAHIVDRGMILRSDDGKAQRMIGTLNDITQRHLAEQQLKESEAKYRHVFNNNPEPMWIYNPETLEFVEVNQAAIEHYGYTQEEFLSMTLADIRPPEDIDEMKKDVENHIGTNSYSEEWTHLKKDGSKIDVEVSASDVQYDHHTFRLVLVNDITEQKQMQEKIIQSVIQGEDRERKRIAHELHDGLGQYLVAASMNFESIKSDIAQLPERRREQFKTGLSLLKQGLSETRNIAHNLMPKAISDYGLLAALENLVANFKKSTDISFNFDHNCDELELKDHAEINIYRICQELISNSVRHANCDTISIRMIRRKNTLDLTIKDDGIGATLTDAHEEGLGLHSIKTRVNNLKGELNVESAEGKGMQTTIKIPNVKRLSRKNGI